jgi:hypothetical protein
MIRLELIANRAVEDDLFEAFRELGIAQHYTKFPVVHGVGGSGPRMGDSVWPEENFALVIWCPDAEARLISRAVASVKLRFPSEGIKLFGM